MQQYPACRYHATEPPRIIQSAAEEAEGWYDSPTKCEPSTAWVGAPVSPDASSTSVSDPTPPTPQTNAFFAQRKAKRKATP